MADPIFEDTPNAPGSTHVLRYLLRNYKKLDRHAFLSAEVLSRSRTTYIAINGQIDGISASTVASLPWDNFEAYSSSVVQLERVLLSYHFKIPDEPRKHVPDVNDVVGGVDFINSFLQDRTALLETLKNLKKDYFEGLPLNFDDDYDRHRLQDDTAALGALFAFFRDYQGPGKMTDNQILDRSKRQQPIIDMRFAIRQIMESLANRPPVIEFSEKIIKSLMLISIPFILRDGSRQSTNLVKDETKVKLGSIKVWLTAQSLVMEIVKSMRGNMGLAEIEEKYNSLLDLLLNLLPPSDPLADGLLELIKLSTNIRRPFHARSVAFVKILWKLDQELDSGNDAGRQELKQVVLKLVETLQDVQRDITDVRGILLNQEPYASLAKKINDLLDETGRCGNGLGLEWATKSTEFRAAVETDTKHLNLMRTNFAHLFI